MAWVGRAWAEREGWDEASDTCHLTSTIPFTDWFLARWAGLAEDQKNHAAEES